MRTSKRIANCCLLSLLFNVMPFYFGNILMAQPWIVDSEGGKIKVEIVTDGIDVPSGLAFLSDSIMLVTNRPKG